MAVAIYIRWSTDEQTEGTTLDVQRDACKHFALSQGWDVPDENYYIDEGYSGGTLDRPAMNRLREAIKQKRVTCIVVYAIDRLSRNIVDAVQLVLREWDGRCHLACVRQPVDTRTEIGRTFFSILATFADFERSQIRTRTMSGKLQRAAEGKSLALGPYGYDRIDGKLVINEAEAVTVRRIFDWYVTGLGLSKILKCLAAEGQHTREGYLWGRSTLNRCLHNPTYAGRHVYGRHRVGQHDEAVKVLRDAPLVDMEGIVPAIIDPIIWHRVQELRQDRCTRVVSGGRAIGSKHLLTSLARCRCGGNIIAKADRVGKIYYLCSKHRDHGLCRCGWIPQAETDAIVTSRLLSLRDPDLSAHLYEALYVETSRNASGVRTLQIAAATALRELDNEADRLDRACRSGQLSPARYERLIAGIERDRPIAEAKLRELTESVAALDRHEQQQTKLTANIARLSAWGSLEMPARKELLRSLVTSLTLFRDNATKRVSIDICVSGVPLEFLN